ncbi:erythrocyte membrane protein 1 (PfEMP1), exon, putative [Plasmodium sp. DRC-Itaito]|nr:erythrocyte membrane protein 1 (PfEMP1), exon, putative [Plasmodium sp. DRC-Itaito]
MLDKLKEQWQNEIHNDDNIPRSNKILSTDVSIRIHMDNPMAINEFSNMDTYPNDSVMDNILDDLDEKFNEPNYYDIYEDDIYYDVNDNNNKSTVNPNNMDVPSKFQIDLDVNKKTIQENFPIGDVWDV